MAEEEEEERRVPAAALAGRGGARQIGHGTRRGAPCASVVGRVAFIRSLDVERGGVGDGGRVCRWGVGGEVWRWRAVAAGWRGEGLESHVNIGRGWRWRGAEQDRDGAGGGVGRNMAEEGSEGEPGIVAELGGVFGGLGDGPGGGTLEKEATA